MSTVLARCCKPVPPDSVVGFVSRGRGTSVHRACCANLGHHPGERLINAEWAARSGHRHYETDVEVFADCQSVPIREVLEVFAHEKVRMIGTSTYTRGPRLRKVATIAVDLLTQVVRVTTLLADAGGVTGVRRC